MGYPDGVGAQALMMPAAECAVIEASTHTQAVPLSIKGNEWGEDDIDGRFEDNSLAVKCRFGNTKLVKAHRSIGLIIDE